MKTGRRKDEDSGGILWLTKREKLQSRKLCANAAHTSFWSNKQTRPKDKTFLFGFDYILKSRYNRSFKNEWLIWSSATKKNTLMLVGNTAGGVLDPALSWTYPQPHHSSCYHHLPDAIIPIFFLCLPDPLFQYCSHSISPCLHFLLQTASWGTRVYFATCGDGSLPRPELAASGCWFLTCVHSFTSTVAHSSLLPSKTLKDPLPREPEPRRTIHLH